MKKRFKIFALLFISTFMFSCHGLLGSIESPEQKTNDDNSSYCTVTASIKNDMDPGLNARSASSHINFSEKKFTYQITAKSTGNPEQSFLIEDKSFSLNLLKGATWKIQIKAFLVDKAFVIGTDIIPAGTAPVLVSNEISFLAGGEESFPSSIALHVNPDDSGNVNLKVTITHDGDPSLSNPIQSCKVTFIDKTLRSSPQANIVKEYGLVTESGENKIKIDYSGMYSGYYLMVMDFYTGALSSNHVTGSVIYTRTEMITVLPESASVDYPIQWDFAGNVDLTIPTSLVNGYRNHTVYVNSEIGEEGKFGTYYDPFTTIEKAVDYIKTVNDGNDENIFYQIVLLNDYSKAVAPGSVLALTTSRNLNLTLKSYGSEFYSITNESTSSTCAVKINAENSSTVNLKIENIALIGKSAHVTSNSGTASGLYVTDGVRVQLAGTCYISSVGGESDSFLTVQSLGTVYQDSTGKITNKSNDGVGNENTLVPKNIKYIPSRYDADNKKINLPAEEGDTTYTKIGIHDQIGSVETKKWTLLSNGFIEIDLPYVSRLTEEPAAGTTIYVKTAQDLEALARIVNTGTNGIITMTANWSLNGITVEQTDNIDLSTYPDWEPIGFLNYFSGDYDGKNYNITNLTISGEISRDNLGLFGYKNLGEIRNCNISGTITLSDAYSTKRSNIGGLVGKLESTAKIYNCISNVEITDEKSKSYIGGLVGWLSDSASVYNCVNVGKIYRTSAGQTGGLIGTISGSLTPRIYNCINNGEIEALSTSGIDVGGIVGSVYAAADISNVINNGDIKVNNSYSSSCIGGLIGTIGSSFYLKNCVMAGQMLNSKTGQYFSLVGGSQNNTYGYSNCYYLSSIPEPKNPSSTATLTDCSSFTLNDPMDDWYGTLETPVNAGEATNVVALVYALNQWVEKNKDTTRPYSQWCVTDGKLAFGTAPTGTPPTPPVASNLSADFIDSINALAFTGTTVYVESAEDLKAFATLVNSSLYNDGVDNLTVDDNTFEGITVVQTADIDLSTLYDAESFPSWDPIGKFPSDQFRGTYNGNNFKIDGLKIEVTGTSTDYGLFGYVRNGEILNCNVSGSMNISGACYADNGGIVAVLQNSKVSNCTANVLINYATTVSSAYAAGGIVGKISNDTSTPSYIDNCVNLGNITTSENTCHAGGIVGNVASKCEITNCINKGTITNNSSNMAKSSGGIVGNIAGAGSKIHNCYSFGDITSLDTTGQAGGIVGNITAASNCSIANCVFNNNIGRHASKYGIVGNSTFGSNSGTVTHCYFTSQYGLLAALEDSSNITASNNNSFTSTQLSTLPTALNSWVDTANASDSDKYLSWAYESSKGLYLLPPPVVANPPIAGHTYASTMASAPSSGTVYIREAADLQQISTWSKTSKLENVTFIMDYDVSLEGVDWNQIGYSSTYRFGGIFDGNGKEILNLSKTIEDDFGFFKRTDGATIKNLKISGDITITGTGGAYGAGFIVYAENTTVRNCINNVNITNVSNTNSYSTNPLTGGIIALCHTTNTIIDGCMNTGTISAKYKGSQIGGIVGSVTTSVTIRNSINKGEIKYEGTSTSNINLGGIIANFNTSNTGYFTIENCANKANFVVTSADSATVSAGGIIGLESTKKAESVIKNCFSIGQIEFPGKNPTDLSISQAGINPTSGSLATMTNCYWDNTKMPNWKNGDNTEDPDNFIKSVNSNSDYYMGAIGSYTYDYLKSYLQLWVDENNTASLYQNWALAPGGQEARGQGEPILPIESGITP